jgi:hypothetical protein
MDEKTLVSARFKLSEEEKARRIDELKARFEAALPGKRKGRTRFSSQRAASRGALAALFVAAALVFSAGIVWLFA